MIEIRKQLVEMYAGGPIAAAHKDADNFYANGPIEEVHKNPAYQTLCRKHEGDAAFAGERKRVEDLRLQVDQYLGPRDSSKSQVEFAFRLLRTLRTTEQQEVCVNLIALSYGTRWDLQQREYFKKNSPFVIQAKHYFLSFTNRNPGKPNLNQVNRNHQFFIIDALGQIAYEHANLSDHNLLAEAIHYHLRNKQFDGFYYPEHKEDNTKVKEKLQDNCIRSFAFVQLVQAEMFRYYQNSPNWCHFEYDEARKTGAGRILFVQVDDQIRGDDIYIGFHPWYREFVDGDPLILQWTRWHDANKIDDNFQKISGKLAKQIERAIDLIYLGIPN